MAEEKEKKPKGAKPSEAEIAARKAAKKAKATESTVAEEVVSSEPAPPPRLIAHYREKVIPVLREKFGITNTLAAPRLEKIVISMGLGKIATSGGADSRSKFEQAEKELSVIAGQKPVRCKAKKSV